MKYRYFNYKTRTSSANIDRDSTNLGPELVYVRKN